MSVEYCYEADLFYDTDFDECCSSCENYPECKHNNYE